HAHGRAGPAGHPAVLQHQVAHALAELVALLLQRLDLALELLGRRRLPAVAGDGEGGEADDDQRRALPRPPPAFASLGAPALGSFGAAAFCPSPALTDTAIHSRPLPVTTSETLTASGSVAPSTRTGPSTSAGNVMPCSTCTGMVRSGMRLASCRRTVRASSSRPASGRKLSKPARRLMST